MCIRCSGRLGQGDKTFRIGPGVGGFEGFGFIDDDVSGIVDGNCVAHERAFGGAFGDVAVDVICGMVARAFEIDSIIGFDRGAFVCALGGGRVEFSAMADDGEFIVLRPGGGDAVGCERGFGSDVDGGRAGGDVGENFRGISQATDAGGGGGKGQ